VWIAKVVGLALEAMTVEEEEDGDDDSTSSLM